METRMEARGKPFIIRLFHYIGMMFGVMWDNSLIRLLKLIDYPRFHRLHFDNLMADFHRLRLGDSTFQPASDDTDGIGFLEIGREYDRKYKSMTDPGSASWMPNIMDVLIFERVIVHFLPDDEIKLRALYIQQRYKSLISESAFDKLQTQMNFQLIGEKTDCRLLRNELDFMLHDLTRGYINAPLPYRARQNIWLYAFWLGIIEYSLAFVLIKLFNLFNDTPIPISALLVPFFGSAGAFLSIKQRVEALPYGHDTYRNIILLNASLIGLIFGLVRGAAFAILLNILMISGLVDGELFPKYDFTNFPDKTGLDHAFGFLLHLNDLPTNEITKILIWSLLAGFSERLVPDTLQRLSDPKNNMNTNASLNTNQGPNYSGLTSAKIDNEPAKTMNTHPSASNLPVSTPQTPSKPQE